MESYDWQGYTIEPHFSPAGHYWAMIIPPFPWQRKIQTNPRRSLKGCKALAERMVDDLIEQEERHGH